MLLPSSLRERFGLGDKCLPFCLCLCSLRVCVLALHFIQFPLKEYQIVSVISVCEFEDWNQAKNQGNLLKSPLVFSFSLVSLLCAMSDRSNHSNNAIKPPNDNPIPILRESILGELLQDSQKKLKKYPVYLCFNNDCFKKTKASFALTKVGNIGSKVPAGFVKEIDFGYVFFPCFFPICSLHHCY